MKKQEVNAFIRELALKRMEMLGIPASELNDDTDLVKEGIFDSLSFVDLLADCETKFGVNIDLENYEPGQFTKVEKLVDLILESGKAK